MQIEIDAKPSYGMAVVKLDKGERIVAESGAMVAMSSGLLVDTQLNGAGKDFFGTITAFFTALARRFLAGETMFVNSFKAKEDGQEVMLSPAMVGDVVHLPMEGRTLTVQASSYLASTPDVVVELVWGGFAMLFGGEGAFFLKCKGKGDLLVNSYGAIEKIEIDGSYIVDTGHVVAFEGDLKTSIRRAGGWKSTLLSGEGLVMEFKGKGSVWLQTRNISALVGWISPFFNR